MENGSTWAADRIATLPARHDDTLLPDEVIVARVIGGEVGLFELIMRCYNQRLYRAARSRFDFTIVGKLPCLSREN